MLTSDPQWDLSSPVMMGWTPHEQLVVMADDGTYRIYDLSSASAGTNSAHPDSSTRAGEYHQYSLGGEIADVGVIEGQVHEDGFVVLTGSLAFVHVKGWTGGRPTTLAASGKPGKNPLFLPCTCIDPYAQRNERTATRMDRHLPRTIPQSARGSPRFNRGYDTQHRRPLLHRPGKSPLSPSHLSNPD